MISLKDIRIRSKREAGLLSMQQAEKFASQILPTVSMINRDLRSRGVVLERKKLFLRSEIKNEIRKSSNLQVFIKVLKDNKDISGRIQRLLNRLEAMSMVFTSGVADESMVYLSLSRAFCTIVEEYYFSIGLSRKDEENNKPYENLLILYRTWLGRIEKNRLSLEIKKLSREAKNINDNEITPIGA